MTCASRNLIYVVICPTFKEATLVKPDLAIPNSEIGSRYTGNMFDSLNMKNIRQKSIFELVAKETSQYFRFYNCVQMTQIFDGNMKIII